MTQEPTHTPLPEAIPTCCYLCGRRAGGGGIGSLRKDGDFRFLCDECVMLAHQIRSIRNFDHYETLAVTETVGRVEPLIAANGTDLAEWTPEQAEEFVAAVVLGFGDSIRRLVREQEVPF
jgi:hypothetical protein